MDARFAVVGLGAVGSMVLWQLAEQGCGENIIGLEASHLADDRTGVGGETRLFRKAYKEGAEFAGLLEESRRLWMELDGAVSAPVFHDCGALTIGDRDRDYMNLLMRSVEASGVDHEVLKPSQLRGRYPQHHVYDSDIGVFDPAGGAIRTNTAVLAAVEKAQEAGAQVRTQEPVLSVEQAGNGVRVTTARDSLLVEQVVIAAGGWSEQLLPQPYAEVVHPERVILTWCSAKDPAQFSPANFPVFIRDTRGTHMFGAPSIDGDAVKVSGIIADHRIPNISELSRSLSSGERQLTLEAVREFFPGLYPTIVRADAYPDLFSRDMKPLLGPVPAAEKIFLATAFSGRGFKMATGVGAAAARSLLSGRQDPAIAFADPGRFSR